jgi:hypothetical protein
MASQLPDPNGHDPWVPLAEAARRTPSNKPGKHMDRETLVRWILSGKLPAMRRGRYYFVRMSDLAALMQPVEPRPKEPGIRTERQMARGHAWALEVLRKRGYKV